MTTAEMMNVVLLSCGHNKRWKRHSIAVFDDINNSIDTNDGWSFN